MAWRAVTITNIDHSDNTAISDRRIASIDVDISLIDTTFQVTQQLWLLPTDEAVESGMLA